MSYLYQEHKISIFLYNFLNIVVIMSLGWFSFGTTLRFVSFYVSYLQPKNGGQCNALKKQNKLLRQMLLSVTDENALEDVTDDEDPFQFGSSQIHLSKVRMFRSNIMYLEFFNAIFSV